MSLNKNKHGLGFANYLTEAKLCSELPLTKNNLLFFHWSNWERSCLLKKQLVGEDSGKKLEELEEQLVAFKKEKVWVQRLEKCMETNLYAIYESYLDSRIRLTWFERDNEFLVSTSQKSGPFVTLTSMRWFDKKVYALFMYRKILLNEVPLRSFRLGCNIPLKCNFDGSPIGSADFTLHQVTESGIMIKVSGSENLTKIKEASKLHLAINLRPFSEVANMDFEETLSTLGKLGPMDLEEFSEHFIIPADIISRYGNDRSIRTSNLNEFFIFCSFNDLEGLSSKNFFVSNQFILKHLMLKIHKELKQNFKDAA